MGHTRDDVVLDPADGLPAMKVGPWAVQEKHARLRRYVEIASGPRKGFLPPVGKGGASFIDLYCGPGRVFDRENREFHDGSSLVAWKASVKTGSAFSQVILGDLDPEFCDATRARFAGTGIEPNVMVGSAVDTAQLAVSTAGKFGLHLAMLDPFSLEALPFDVIRILSELKRIDLVIHVSTSDLQRNLPRFLESRECELDLFAPGWRNAIRNGESQELNRRRILEYWKNLIRETGLEDCEAIAHVRAGKNQTLYWLVHASRHKLAHRFWATAEDSGPQRRLL